MTKQQERKLPRSKAAYERSISKILKKSEKTTPETDVQAKKETYLWEILAFILPFIFMAVGFSLSKIYPFGTEADHGTKQFLVTDLWHQYYPFFQLLHEKLQEGGSLLYSWRTGMGTNFLALIAYYAASPLHIFSIFVPQEHLREAMLIILMFKFSFAGLFFAKMLRYCFKKNDISITIFGVMFALCSYMMGYYWNTIWIDTVALMPLVMLGLVALVREGKYRTYVISLSLALLSNYYIAYFICIFTVLAFFCLCWFENTGIRKFGKRFALITGTSLLGAGLSAWILLPTYFGLQMTHSVDNSFPKSVSYYENWGEILANMLAFQEPTSKSGLPNLYCGLLPVLLLGVFLIAKKIRIREKICAVVLMAFLIVSCNMNVLNFIWHGFHFTNMLPYRFSFLFSFVLLVAAYRAYQILLEEKLHIVHWIAMLVTGAGFCVLAHFTNKEDDNKFIYASAILGAVYLAVMLCRTFMNKQLVQLLIASALIFEMGQHSINGVKSVGSSTRNGYPTSNADVQTLLRQSEGMEDELFWRTELTMWYTLNDPSMYYYNGMSQFSSMANKRVTTFIRMLGLPASEAGNRYFYANTSPFTNMLLDIQYLIAKDGYNADKLTMTEVGKSGNATLYQNKYALSLGFMMEKGVGNYTFNEQANAFEIQNDLFRAVTGVQDDLFTKVDITHVGHTGYKVTRTDYGNYTYRRNDDAPSESYLKYNYTTTKDGMVYGYMKVKDGDNMDVYYNGGKTHRYNIGRQPYITPLGNYKAGEMVTLRCDLDDEATNGTITVYFYEMNTDVLNEGYAALEDEVMELTSFSDTALSGKITAKEDGYLYLSIPYEEGWSLYVDGEEREVEPLFGGMCGVKLDAGDHTIEMDYSPKGFVPGLMISIGGWALLVVLWVLEKRGIIGKPKPVPAAANPEETVETETSESEAT